MDKLKKRIKKEKEQYFNLNNQQKSIIKKQLTLSIFDKKEVLK